MSRDSEIADHHANGQFWFADVWYDPTFLKTWAIEVLTLKGIKVDIDEIAVLCMCSWPDEEYFKRNKGIR